MRRIKIYCIKTKSNLNFHFINFVICFFIFEYCYILNIDPIWKNSLVQIMVRNLVFISNSKCLLLYTLECLMTKGRLDSSYIRCKLFCNSWFSCFQSCIRLDKGNIYQTKSQFNNFNDYVYILNFLAFPIFR